MARESQWRRSNPPARPSEFRRVHTIAREIAREEAARGAAAVVLSGSWARGDAHRHSDLDLWVIGRTGRHRFYDRDGVSVSLTRKSVPATSAEFRAPRYLGQVVRAWREAVILHDPRRLAVGWQRRARTFVWDEVAERLDRYVAGTLTATTEEVAKLVRSMARGRRATAAVQRNLLAGEMAFLVAIDHRLAYDENELWQVAGHVMGKDWARAQARALALGGESGEASCRAALELFIRTAESMRGRLAPDQRRVVTRGIDLARRASGGEVLLPRRRGWTARG